MSTRTIAALLIVIALDAAGCAASAPLPVYSPPPAHPVTIAPANPATAAPVPGSGNVTVVPAPQFTGAPGVGTVRTPGPQPEKPPPIIDVPRAPAPPQLLPSDPTSTTAEPETTPTEPTPSAETGPAQ